MSDKFKHSDYGFNYFIGYKEGEIVKLLCIILPQMTGFEKIFENGGKTCLSQSKMIMCWINKMKFGTRLKRH